MTQTPGLPFVVLAIEAISKNYFGSYFVLSSMGRPSQETSFAFGSKYYVLRVEPSASKAKPDPGVRTCEVLWYSLEVLWYLATAFNYGSNL